MGKAFSYTVVCLITNTYYDCCLTFTYEYNAPLLSIGLNPHTLSIFVSLSSLISSPHHFYGVLHPFSPKLPWWSNIFLYACRRLPLLLFHLLFLTGWFWWSCCFAQVLSVVVCCSCIIFADNPQWMLLVSGWHTFHHLHVFFCLMPHFVPRLSTLPSFYVIISIFPASSPLSLSVSLVIFLPTRLCLALASVCGAVRASVSALWAKDAAGIGVEESQMH